jgi:hypothetical protein
VLKLKFHDAVDVAFVFWLLMVPPVNHRLNDTVDENASLASWTTEYRYGSLDMCKAAVKNLNTLVPMGPEEFSMPSALHPTTHVW